MTPFSGRPCIIQLLLLQVPKKGSCNLTMRPSASSDAYVGPFFGFTGRCMCNLTQPNLITEASVAQFTFSVFWLHQKGHAETLQSLSRAESLMSLAQLVASQLLH